MGILSQEAAWHVKFLNAKQSASHTPGLGKSRLAPRGSESSQAKRVPHAAGTPILAPTRLVIMMMMTIMPMSFT